MGTSNWQNIPFCTEVLMKIEPMRVLDVGVGFGRWGIIVREFCENWTGRELRKDWKIHIEGIEAFADCITDYHYSFYDKIHIADARKILPALLEERWDVVVFGDVIEHFAKAEGIDLLTRAIESSIYVLLNVPIGSEWPQEDLYGNPYERHLSEWSANDVLGFALRQQAFFSDFMGRPFASYVFSKSDPKGLAHSLFSKSTVIDWQASTSSEALLSLTQRQLLAQVEQLAQELKTIQFVRDLFKSIRLTAEVRHLRGKMLVDLSETMTSYALAPEVKDPLKFARDLFKSIRLTAKVRRMRRKVLGQVNAELAFRHRQAGGSNQVWRHALKAVIQDPTWLKNRGLVRIGLEGGLDAVLGGQILSRRTLSYNFLNRVSKTTCIVISPHFDDAALSCGGTLAHLARRRADILLVTVFTADLAEGTPIPPLAREFHKFTTGDEKYPFKRRGLEELEVVRHLEAKYRWLDFLDGIYRYPEMKAWAEQFRSDFEPRTDACFEPVRDALLQIISEHPSATVFAPLGLGYHRDHLIVHQALEDIKNMTSTVDSYYYYEDFPYAASADLQTRLGQLNWPAQPVAVDIGATLAERVHLIERYTSQRLVLFGDNGKVYEQVESYATRVGAGDKPQERFWSPRASN
jgi:LmbE family N-acetylglucosaminyl deacetylase